MITVVRVVTMLLTATGLAAGIALAFGPPSPDAFFTTRDLVALAGVGVISAVMHLLTYRGRGRNRAGEAD